jgi:hypothetical protein
MKTTTYSRTPKFHTFLGEYSKQWVGVMYINGQRIRSIQRPTQAMAEYDIRNHSSAPRFL